MWVTHVSQTAQEIPKLDLTCLGKRAAYALHFEDRSLAVRGNCGLPKRLTCQELCFCEESVRSVERSRLGYQTSMCAVRSLAFCINPANTKSMREVQDRRQNHACFPPSTSPSRKANFVAVERPFSASFVLVQGNGGRRVRPSAVRVRRFARSSVQSLFGVSGSGNRAGVDMEERQRRTRELENRR